MTAVVPFFVLGVLVLVPLGYRLLETAVPAARPPEFAMRAVLPAAVLLAISFRFAPGPAAAVLATPWAVVAGMTAAVAVGRLLRDAKRFHPDVRHAVDAAVMFLAVGAAFALVDRAGVALFGFPPALLFLAAVHFTFAGFVLPVAGALAYRRRPRRWLEAALGVIVVGIPLTALGFFDLPVVNWVGAMLMAGGGFAIGLATIGVARGLTMLPARGLAVVAGASLLVSMPLAAVYATGTVTGAVWLGLETMARVHGGLNAIGFALPAMLAWTLDRRVLVPSPPRPVTSPARRWWLALTVGSIVGVGVLVGGPLVALIGIGAVLLLAIEPPRGTPIGGLMTGFGAAWIILFARAGASCDVGCAGPDLAPWFAFAGAMLAVGLVLSARIVRPAPIRDAR